ncbi:hypothetical protein [Helicobacter sp. MIT 05-5294]|uniref:hypothetical protein n=1 Tax=Helicobacter sp. MIT 05-5294 TaxID=1548150 RepID=UPI0010FE2A21|nr:hypothetical protein [Helicobacter sp. MIT 05-5294]TLD87804.1 hypothetical protein LS69_003135 [Helicobacter sp. MIT 05-5294]
MKSPMKIFGTMDLESLQLPPQLSNAFCVIGTQQQCMQAIDYTLSKLESRQRVESLILIEPPTPNWQQLHTITSYGCKIYSYFTESQKVDLQHYQDFAQYSLVLIINAPHAK